MVALGNYYNSLLAQRNWDTVATCRVPCWKCFPFGDQDLWTCRTQHYSYRRHKFKNKTTTKTQNSNKADVFYLWLLNTCILPQGIAMYLKAFDSKSILGLRRRASILGAYQLWAGTANCTFVQPIINSLTIHFWVVENMIKPSDVGLFLCLLFCKKDPLVTPYIMWDPQLPERFWLKLSDDGK